MTQRVRVEYSQTLSRDFQATKFGAAYEFDAPDDVQFQEAYNQALTVVKTVVDIAAGAAGNPGVGGQVSNVVNVAPPVQSEQQQGETAPVVQEDDFDAEAAFGPEPDWVKARQAAGPPPPPPASRAPGPQIPTSNAAPPPPPRPQAAPPPPPPPRAAQPAQSNPSRPQGPLPQMTDIVEGEPVYYANCKVIKNESVPIGQSRKQQMFVSAMGPQGLPVSGTDNDGKAYQSATASSFDPAVSADMQQIPVQAKVNIWGVWKGWKGNEDRVARGEAPKFDLTVEAIQLAQ